MGGYSKDDIQKAFVDNLLMLSDVCYRDGQTEEARAYVVAAMHIRRNGVTENTLEDLQNYEREASDSAVADAYHYAVVGVEILLVKFSKMDN